MSHKNKEILSLRQLLFRRNKAIAEAKSLLIEIESALISIRDRKSYLLDGFDDMGSFLDSLKPHISRSHFYKKFSEARKSGGVNEQGRRESMPHKGVRQ